VTNVTLRRKVTNANVTLRIKSTFVNVTIGAKSTYSTRGKCYIYTNCTYENVAIETRATYPDPWHMLHLA
jgi:hypothetical protein